MNKFSQGWTAAQKNILFGGEMYKYILKPRLVSLWLEKHFQKCTGSFNGLSNSSLH